ncbi:NAD(P)/FAD-dependent oxidoreductase [Gelidibacter salicanalis]|uniref:NAD(P)/FAD-dependent oxidoreductase n=1 Tax=Gelidibacter salicanalis TaxID=291193 RepID=A0A5C7AKC0_9FLAO|nr:NAD(P)/FAD-dependent oxidoreductase [Gelidibacter salicanalis]TXE09186.1 NAD(P)/FAD-dependent oxidoreductase [Gelidibacter salicanalis]
MNYKDVLIVGGGAAGFFAAINIAEQHPNRKVSLLERGKEGLQKVRISGGGRCNVTHAEFIPSELVLNYPRGEKELLGPFHQFMTGDTIEWFEKRGVALKIEEDGRMFPVSDSSQTIIDCFLNEAKKHKVEVLYNESVKLIEPSQKDAADAISQFKVETQSNTYHCNTLVIATGSNSKIWKILESLGHTISPAVPSLFTFNITDKRIADIPGVVARNVEITVEGTDLFSEGPLLITHVGMSAPAILKLSAYGALELAALNYKFDIAINFIKQSFDACIEDLKAFKLDVGKKTVYKSPQFELPKRLWYNLVLASDIDQDTRWADLNKYQLESLAAQLTQAIFKVDGKSTFKEEFVTAGGVTLKEVNFKTFESKVHENLFFAGEVLNIDAVTGGFNFQNAWTGAYIVSRAL